MLRTTIRPCRARLARVSTTLRAMLLSKPEVGSSKRITEGAVSSSIAIDSRLRSPPESPRFSESPTRVFRTSERPRSSSTCETRDRSSVSDIASDNRRRAAISSVSHTVRVATKQSSWRTYPICFCRQESLVAVPLIVTVPVTLPVDFRPARMSTRDVLPLPVGPMTATSWLRTMWLEQSRSTCLVVLGDFLKHECAVSTA
mmetsp:Transcript_1979/g.4533  ORF Transcript_1979/g.4533 Transcript_1979/m.4533 type:complete len:201 (+) Transcript_1979:1428-2030(+)